VIRRLQGTGSPGRWPRRIAAAEIDLSLALIASGKPDEAAATTQAVITSGRVVPSNYWRVGEVVAGVEAVHLPEARHLRDAYETMRRQPW